MHSFPGQKALVKSIKKLAHALSIEIKRYDPDEFTRRKVGEIEFALESIQAYVGREIDRDLYAFCEYCRNHYEGSKSQLLQDLFVQFILKGKDKGYFVEFGATNGVDLSNTYLLEKKYGWNGLLAEPAKYWHRALAINRSCKIDHRCVWSKTGEILEFNETAQPELLTLGSFSNRDLHAAARSHSNNRYSVETISLNDFLNGHNVPKEIDYLSIDTEGSEYKILASFDFKKYNIHIITVEHNYVEPDRGNLFRLLSTNGYQRKFEALSHFDDWYVRGGD